MAIKYLMDENVDPVYPTQLRRRMPEISIRVVGEIGTPPKGTLDPEILKWCERYNFSLVTNNRSSMPGHLNDHLARGDRVPGIFILNPDLSIGQNLEELIIIFEAAFDDEYQNQIVFLPIPKNS